MACRFQTKIINFFFLPILLLLLLGCNSPKAETTESLRYNTSNLRSGDIILRKSFGLISEIVVVKLQDTIDISHCGIIYVDSKKNYQVIHSLSKKVSDADGVQICSLNHFMEDSKLESVRVVRLRIDTSNIVSNKALHYLQQKIPFDELFDIKDTSSFFCSELPIHIIKSGFSIDISQGATEPKFSIFLNPHIFKEIPFISK